MKKIFIGIGTVFLSSALYANEASPVTIPGYTSDSNKAVTNEEKKAENSDDSATAQSEGDQKDSSAQQPSGSSDTK